MNVIISKNLSLLAPVPSAGHFVPDCHSLSCKLSQHFPLAALPQVEAWTPPESSPHAVTKL